MTKGEDMSSPNGLLTFFLRFLTGIVSVMGLAGWTDTKEQNLCSFLVGHGTISVAAAIVLVLSLTKFVAFLIRWWLDRHYSNVNIQLKVHHFIRDSGLFDALMNIMSVSNIGHLWKHPQVIWQNLQLLWRRHKLQYGPSVAQHMEIFFPFQLSRRKNSSGLIFFVHGGAWGSGSPSMYRLIALPFLNMNFAVAVLGYRTYPEGDASTQVQDVELALAELARQYPEICSDHICVMGHSSGAHIVLLTVVERMRRLIELERTKETDVTNRWRTSHVRIDSIVGISGPYNISDHFGFESGRGVEQISPMKPANGNSLEMFRRYSPADQFSKIYTQCCIEEQQLLRSSFPKVALLHGLRDDTVPSSSTREASRVLKQSCVQDCTELYLKDVGHEESIIQVMLGGPVRDALTALFADQFNNSLK